MSLALPSSKVPAFSDKGSLGDEMLAAALLKAKSQVSCGSLYHFVDVVGAATSIQCPYLDSLHQDCGHFLLND